MITENNIRWHRNKSWATGNEGYFEILDNKKNILGNVIVDREDLFRCILKNKWKFDKVTGVVVCGAGENIGKTLGRFILCFSKE